MLNRLQFSRLIPLRRSGARKSPQDTSGVESSQGAAPTVPARVVCVASGKGGTGKSVLASNLAIQRSLRGERVLLVDFDAGMANAHLLLGMAPTHDLGHVLEGQIKAKDAVMKGPHGLSLLSGGVGRQSLINPTRRQLDRLFKALIPLESLFDLIVIDHGAGLGYSTLAHLAATTTLILVTNPELTALSDAYALYKRAVTVNPTVRVGVVINRASDEALALAAWERFRGAASRFLGQEPDYMGWVPDDPAITQSVQQRSPVTVSWPDSPAARSIQAIVGWEYLDLARGATPFYQRARRALR